MAPAMSDWSALPMDLVNLISQGIDTEIDLIRFRSVCCNWRSSSIRKHHLNILPFEFPLFKFRSLFDSIINDNTIPFFCYLSKCSFFLIKPPHEQQQTLIRHRPWLVRIRQYSNGKTQILNPLISYQSPFDSLHSIDFNKLSVIHLGTDFIVHDDSLLYDYMYPEKIVAFTGNEKKPIVLGAFTTTSKPILLKCSNENRNGIPVMTAWFEDICIFKGRPYVVHKTGRTATLGLDDFTFELVAESLVSGGGDIKFLVESDGDLLLVDVYESIGFDLMVNVLRLDEKEMRWVNLMSLGDRVLFLGNGCSFSASASDLCVSKGNCVIFIDDAILNFNFENILYGNCIFDLVEGRVSPLCDCPEYFNLFWPPPDWIVKRS
ncbi:hypothetical protein MtrunA17_Chr3g0088841 [Medicago truncatula]|uniref:F-box SKIP23-like protein n=1 Tax=Medicago truncatula TaxID=3880 RepID=G7IWN8_MEDTR|nr:F-box protein SKIP23 [Medicago truncatula]AES69451.1 F-box SKIP23-like protein [Medicago truncatula]RHN66251.1 hypothetical protein MtrunA17_Chr3g0088841 [Medicago truncatula]